MGSELKKDDLLKLEEDFERYEEMLINTMHLRLKTQKMTQKINTLLDPDFKYKIKELETNTVESSNYNLNEILSLEQIKNLLVEYRKDNM